MILKEIPIKDIIPGNNIRRTQTSTAGLTSSVRSTGLLGPITVQEIRSGKYEIITGHRRFAAMQAAGEKIIPAIVKNSVNEIQRLEEQITENVQRENLTALDEAVAYDRYLELTGVSVNVFAKRIGISPSYLSSIRSIAKHLSKEEKAEVRALSKQPTRECLIKAVRETNPEQRKFLLHGDTKGAWKAWEKEYEKSPEYRKRTAQEEIWRHRFRLTITTEKANVEIVFHKKRRVTRQETMEVLNQAKIDLADIKQWPPKR